VLDGEVAVGVEFEVDPHSAAVPLLFELVCQVVLPVLGDGAGSGVLLDRPVSGLVIGVEETVMSAGLESRQASFEIRFAWS